MRDGPGTPGQQGVRARRAAIGAVWSLAALAVAVWVRRLIDPVLGERLALVTLYGPVALAVLLGGWRLATLVAIVGYLACDYLFVQPRGHFGLAEASGVVGLVAYLVTCGVMVLLGEALRGAVAKSRRLEAESAARAALEESRQQLDMALEGGRIGMWWSDPVSGFQDCTRLNLEVFGFDPGGPIPTREQWLERIHPEDRERVLEAWRTGAERGTGYTAQYRALLPDGTVRWIESRAVLARTAGGPLRFAGVSVDVTKQKAAEEERERLVADLRAERRRLEEANRALAESERRYRTIAEMLPYGGWMLDAQGRIAHLSPAFLDMLGQTLEEHAAGWRDLLHPDDRDRIVGGLTRWLADGEPWEEEYRIRGKDGAYRTLLSRGVPVRDERGRLECWVGINLDLTGRKAVEERASHLADMLEATPDFVAVSDTEGRLVYMNRAGRRMVGIPEEGDLDEYRHAALCPAWVFEKTQRVWMPEALRTGSASGEGALLTLDGREIPVSFVMLVHRDASGAPERVSTIARDVSERRRAEEALAARERQLRFVTDHAPVYIVHCDAQQRYKFVNAANAERLGFTPEAMIGRTIREVVGEAAYASFSRHVEAALRGERVEFEERIPYEGAGPRWMRCVYVPEVDGAGAVQGFVAVIQDITKKREALDALAASRERYRAFIANSSEGIWRLEFDPPIDTTLPVEEQVELAYRRGRFAECNDVMARMYGLERAEDLVGRGLDFMLPSADAGAREYIAGIIRNGYRAVDVESEERDAHGNRVYFANSMTGVIAGGGLLRVWGTQRDISERKRAEAELARHREELEGAVAQRTAELAESARKLHASERLAALGNLAAGLGHDIANLGLPIRARLAALAAHCTTAEARADIDAIAQAMGHLAELSTGLRLMALDPERESASNFADDLRGWWSHVEGLLRGTLPRSVRLEPRIDPGLGVRMPAHRLTQAVFNLVQNAGEALADRPQGCVRVEATARGDAVEVRVSDNGPGMPPEVLERCFQPYFSTKGRSIATGMGLAMVRGLVQAAGGRVEVESTPGRGATFTLALPRERRGGPSEAGAEPARARTAAVSVPEARTAAVAAMLLASMEMKVVRADGVRAPEADVWVVADPAWSAVAEYLERWPRGRVIVMRSGAGGGGSAAADPEAAGVERDERVVVVPGAAPPSVLRAAVREAVRGAVVVGGA